MSGTSDVLSVRDVREMRTELGVLLGPTEQDMSTGSIRALDVTYEW
jgi:hypothetical protein